MALDLFQHGQMILQISSFEKLLHHKVSKLIVRQLHLGQTQIMKHTSLAQESTGIVWIVMKSPSWKVLISI